MKEFLEHISQNKNFLMFVTSIIYILGLFAYFTGNAIAYCSVVSILAIIAIIKDYFSPKLVLFWMFIFFLAFFNASLRIKDSDMLFKIAPTSADIYGQIVSIPNVGKNGTLKFFFDVDKINYQGKTLNIKKNKTLVNIKNYTNIEKPNIGEYYRINGELQQPFKASNPSQFSYGNYLRNFNAYTLFYTRDGNYSIIHKQLSIKWKILQSLNNSRNSIIKSHSQFLKSPNLEILGGIVFGDDAIAPPDYIRTTFINSGLLHILAASGMNVAFIYGFLYFFLRKLRVPYKISVLSGIAVVVLYSLMTGLGASVVRAAIMLIFILIGKLINRDTNSISLLSFVALLMLLYNPAYINDVGFQLSFIVTFGLLLSTNIIMSYTKSVPAWLAGAIVIPVIAQIWVIPIQMFYFNNVSLYSVFSNVFTLPFLSIISFGGFVSSVFALIKPIATQVCFVSDLALNPLLTILVWISTFFSNLPHSLLITTHPSVLQVIIYYSILVLGMYLLKTQFENKKLFKFVLVLAVILLVSTINIPNHNLEVISFAVQEGDAFLLKTPQNKYIIIDTGRNGFRSADSTAKIVILKYMRDRGIKNIDSMVLTHFDSDHAGGAVDLMDGVNIKNIYVNSLSDKSKIAHKIYKTAKRNKNTKILLVKGYENIYNLDGLTINLDRAYVKKQRHITSVDNENSIITIVKYNKFKMLFTGDLGTIGFYKMKKDIPQNITVLKVPHHGAKDVLNRNIVRYLSPKISVVSVGPNHYGHPNGLTLKLLQKSKIYRTDRQNSIKIIVTKKDYSVETFDSQKHEYKKDFEGKNF